MNFKPPMQWCDGAFKIKKIKRPFGTRVAFVLKVPACGD
jgi:hypothetical protein